MIAFVLFTMMTLVRMAFLPDAIPYRENALMGANFVFLAFVLMIFMCFNLVFIGGFFKTAYNFGRPFVVFVIVTFLIIGVAESLHYIPGLKWMNTLDFSNINKQIPVLVIAALVYVLITVISCKISQKRFERIDM